MVISRSFVITQCAKDDLSRKNTLKYENLRLCKAGKDTTPALCIFLLREMKTMRKRIVQEGK